ncbi:MAG: endopeptidase La [Holophagales bacterium]|nr:endopeptidase La [Holophagales bacterium]
MAQNPVDEQANAISLPDVLPVLPLKDAVIFPYIILPLSISRDPSMLAVEDALNGDRIILLAPQRDGSIEEPGEEDLHEIGTAAQIMRMLKLPDGRVRILIQGLARARLRYLSQTEPFLRARVEEVDEASEHQHGLEAEALVRSVKEGLETAVNLGKDISSEVMVIAANLDHPGRLADLAASNLDLRADEAQIVLETTPPIQRLRKVGDLLTREIELLSMQQRISAQARSEMDRSQREYFLRQQQRAILDELGEGDDLHGDIERYVRAVEEKGLSEEAATEVERQVRRLERSSPDSAENATIRTHLDWLTGLPWTTLSEDRIDLDRARAVLDEDHYDLDRVKERILEYLAVRRLKPDAKGPILCLVGPPGVGKTSLGRSIARAIDRKFVRISLGGVRDEGEIRGHRRTYVGSLPGRIIQGLNQAGTSNPVFMLDEIDKLGADYRGDPASALLEVLDPEQNSTFRDHYLGVEYDLSRVLFIATANLLEPIQPAFLDRLEVLRLSGYTEDEKVLIARRHLLPKATDENGLPSGALTITTPALRRLIRGYTKEAGVRNLEREIATLCRKAAVRVARGDGGELKVTPARLKNLIGQPRHFSEELLDRDRIGVATGLAWTASGGDLMLIEVAAPKGRGKLILTGQLGDVMKESAQAALSCARTTYAGGPAAGGPDFFRNHDLHIHVPAGSVPKDGPSAGVTIAAAIVSVCSGRMIDHRVAMTGEITLRGEVLPVGGLKEKLLAARGAGIRKVVLPERNRRDLPEIPTAVTRGLELLFVEHVDQVLEAALLDPEHERSWPAAKTG